MELVYADQLYIGGLYQADDDLEKFLRFIVLTPTLDGIQPIFDVNVYMPFTSVNNFNAHPLLCFTTLLRGMKM